MNRYQPSDFYKAILENDCFNKNGQVLQRNEPSLETVMPEKLK